LVVHERSLRSRIVEGRMEDRMLISMWIALVVATLALVDILVLVDLVGVDLVARKKGL
jgi:hypothetical protein